MSVLQLSLTVWQCLPVFSTTSAAAARLDDRPPANCGAFRLFSTAALLPPSCSNPTALVHILCVLCATLQTHTVVWTGGDEHFAGVSFWLLD